MSLIAYFDCCSGISGDMILGAFIDLGVPINWLKKELKEKIVLDDYDISTDMVVRHGITARKVTVEIQNDKKSRNYSTIRSLIDSSQLENSVKKKSIDIFEKIAIAESKIHNCKIDNVHFHEIGGIDAIVDIIGSVLCLNYLNIKHVVSSPVPFGTGFTQCLHGTIPIPAPATLEILKGIPVYGTGIEAELVTPTGAAIIASIANEFDHIPEMTIDKIGIGAGTRELQKVPNILRIITGKSFSDKNEDILIIETNIDDMNPEIYGYLMECLFEDGALDVYWLPVYMKKNRPGTLIQVLCRIEDQIRITNRILSETTSTGVRKYRARRHILERENRVIETTYGKVNVKQIIDPEGNIVTVPEYEECKKIAREKGIPIKLVYETVVKEGEA